MLGLVLLAPFLFAPFAMIAYDDARVRAGRARTRRGRIVAAGVVAAVAATPLAFLVALGAYGDFTFIAAECLVGFLYGAIVAGTVMAIRGCGRKRRDGIL